MSSGRCHVCTCIHKCKCTCAHTSAPVSTHAHLVQLCKVDVVWLVLKEGGHALLKSDELTEEGTNVWHSWSGAPADGEWGIGDGGIRW